MNNYFIYDLADHYLGEVLAINGEDALVMADVVFPVPHRVLTYRLTYNLRIVA